MLTSSIRIGTTLDVPFVAEDGQQKSKRLHKALRTHNETVRQLEQRLAAWTKKENAKDSVKIGQLFQELDFWAASLSDWLNSSAVEPSNSYFFLAFPTVEAARRTIRALQSVKAVKKSCLIWAPESLDVDLAALDTEHGSRMKSTFFLILATLAYLSLIVLSSWL